MTDRPVSEVAQFIGRLREATASRIALGRAGQGMPTAAMLDFRRAHAAARDAVHAKLDIAALKQALDGEAIEVRSQAQDRETYLKNPDAGRTLDESCMDRLAKGDYDVSVVIADGLSAFAANRNAIPVLKALVRTMPETRFAPVVLATGARVGLGDGIGETLGATTVIMLIGERPGLSSADSMGAYITRSPRPGRLDSERNCISNIRPSGLDPTEAARAIAWILQEAERLGQTGVVLKDRRTNTLSNDGPAQIT